MKITDIFSTAVDHFESSRWAQAKTLFFRILEQEPDHVGSLHLLGVIALGEGQGAIAVGLIGKAAAIEPNGAMLCDLGNAYNTLGDSPSALDCYRKVVALEPDHAEAYSNLGVLLQAQGQINEAIECFRKSEALKPLAETYSNLGCALKDVGEYEAAIENFEKSLSIKPDYPRTYSNLFFCLNHMEGVGPEELFAAHLRFGARYDNLPKLTARHCVVPDPQRRLRLGFVSGDLRNHSVAYFIEPFWAELDHEQVEIWVYSNHIAEDDFTNRLKSLVHHWRNISSLSDADLALGICSDSIDILIDLSGHTARNRLLVFARKPAPIQVSWLGYPGTTGLRAMDYYIADHSFAPKGLLDPYFTEKIVRLPSVGTYQPFKDSPPVNQLPALVRGFFTFGSFNRTSKLEEGCIALWSQVLKAVPDSRMLLGNVSDERQGALLIERFSRYGIAKDRLSFRPAVPMFDYLELHNEIDLILDTFPYTGCTTTAHAAWMGVPVLTIAGKTMPSLLGATMMNQFELPQFVADSADMLLKKTVEWTGKPGDLNAIRLGMRDHMLGLPVAKRKTLNRAFEKAVRIMWQRKCESLEPVSFDVDLEP